MPIVIHELVVTAELEQRPSNASGEQTRVRQADREELIRECTEQVLKLLERQRER